jgi:hypothetical protein
MRLLSNVYTATWMRRLVEGDARSLAEPSEQNLTSSGLRAISKEWRAQKATHQISIAVAPTAIANSINRCKTEGNCNCAYV